MTLTETRHAIRRAVERGDLVAVEVDGERTRRVFLRAEVQRWLGSTKRIRRE